MFTCEVCPFPLSPCFSYLKHGSLFSLFFLFSCVSPCVFSTFPFCSFSFGLLVVCVFLRLFCRVCVVCFCLVVFFLFHVSLLRFTLFLPFSVILFSSRFEFATPCNSLSKILLVLLNMCLPTPHLQLHLLNLMLRFIPLLCPVPTAPREIAFVRPSTSLTAFSQSAHG